VHISKATLDCLEEAYDTEPGHGENRDAYLRVTINHRVHIITARMLIRRAAGSRDRNVFDQRTRTVPGSAAAAAAPEVTENEHDETAAVVGREIVFQRGRAETCFAENR